MSEEMSEQESQDFTEYGVQKKLAFNFSKDITIPNYHFYGQEIDFLRITKSLMAYEYEIKTSAQDYYRDKKKYQKHKNLSGELSNMAKPNYFYYVLANFTLQMKAIPDYAGVLILMANGELAMFKKAPKLHTAKISVETLRKISKAMSYKLWNYPNLYQNRATFR